MLPTAYGFARLLLRPLLRRGLRWRTAGLENLPPDGAVIVACNHISLTDPPAVAYLADTRGREARFLAAAGLFRAPLLGSVLRRMGHIPVERATARAAGSLEPACAALARGNLVVIFPEGGLSPDLEPRTGRTGVARLARASGVAVVPVGVWGTHRLHAAGRLPRWRPGLVVAASAGAPIEVGDRESDRQATDRIMAEVGVQLARARALYDAEPPAAEARWRARHRPRGST